MDYSADAPQLQYPAPLALERGATLQANEDAVIDMETPILIVGGGPVGMIQALIFARIHHKPCILIEREAATTTFPKMEYTNGRSMEIYRKMGLHDELRAYATAEVPEKYNNDELIVTGLAKGSKLVHTWERDGAADQRKKSQLINDGSQYLEPHLRCHQILIEKWLQEKVQAEQLISSYWATAFLTHEEHDDHVLSKCQKADGTTLHIKSQFVIGCDGGGSWVRKSAGLESPREYLNMTMVFVHFRSKTLRKEWPFPRAWHTNIIGGGIFVSQNEDDLWTCHMIVPPGVDPTTLTPDDILAITYGGCTGPVPVPYEEIYCRGLWKVDVAVANRFLTKGGRVFLAGDAAHQISPVGGHGLNSGIGDAFDLAWKLSARIDSWGGDKLLSTYDTERRQIAFENIGHVTKALHSIVMPIFTAHVKHGADILAGEGPESEKVRAEVVEACKAGHWLHDQNGNILGYSYKKSPVILETNETRERPVGSESVYVPTTYPGNQAPHVWMTTGKSTLDLLSAKAFSLVDFSEGGALNGPFIEGARHMGVPLELILLKGEENVKKVYERDIVLVRPDGHVAWRSAEGASRPQTKEEVVAILRTATGRDV